MFDLSYAGLIGALIGLGFGLLQFGVTQRVIRRALTREAAAEKPDAMAVERVITLMKPIRLALLVAALVVYPIVGYVVGAPYASQTR